MNVIQGDVRARLIDHDGTVDTVQSSAVVQNVHRSHEHSCSHLLNMHRLRQARRKS